MSICQQLFLFFPGTNERYVRHGYNDCLTAFRAMGALLALSFSQAIPKSQAILRTVFASQRRPQVPLHTIPCARRASLKGDFLYVHPLPISES